MTVHETAHDSVEHGPASDPARTGSSRSPSTVLASRRLRDLVLVVLVVLAFVVTRRDLPLFERTALAESPDSTDFIGVTVATAWLTTAVVLVMGTVLAAVLAGAAAALVHRVVGRLTRDEARPLGTALSTLVGAYFAVRLAVVGLTHPEPGPDEMVAFAALDVDLGLAVAVVLAAVVARRVAAASWQRSVVAALVVAAVVAVFVNWRSLV